MARKKNTNYWGQIQDDLIRKHNTTSDQKIKDQCFADLYPVLVVMAESIISRYFPTLTSSEDEFNDLVQHCVVKCYSVIHKYNDGLGTKAYSFFGTVMKNHLHEISRKQKSKRVFISINNTIDDTETSFESRIKQLQVEPVEFELHQEADDDAAYRVLNSILSRKDITTGTSVVVRLIIKYLQTVPVKYINHYSYSVFLIKNSMYKSSSFINVVLRKTGIAAFVCQRAFLMKHFGDDIFNVDDKEMWKRTTKYAMDRYERNRMYPTVITKGNHNIFRDLN